MNTHTAGARYERRAESLLRSAGWSILGRNVRFGRNEIDLIIQRSATVAFVEVKGRSKDDFGHPLAAITHRKRRSIERVATWWVSRFGPEIERSIGRAPTYRFDAVAVFGEGTGRIRVEHVEDAWRSESGTLC